MRIKRGSFLLATGAVLLLAALGLTAYNLYEGMAAQKTAAAAVTHLETVVPPVPAPVYPVPEDVEEVEIPDYLLDPTMEMPTEQVGDWAYIGVLEIPSLGLSLPVIEDWNYPALRVAPCRYTGSAYRDDLIIVAHNYRAHFASLQELTPGDKAIFTDMDGNVFSYEMVERETLAPTSVEEMKSGDWDLTLFTCTVGGQYRVTVRFERMDALL